MPDLKTILETHPFFKGLSQKHMVVLAGCASTVRFNKGQFFFHEGEEANSFYIVRRGRVALEIAAPGRKPIVIQTIGESEVLGWSWMVPPYRWHFDARADAVTEAIVLDAACLRAECQNDHDLGYELLKRFTSVVVARLQATRLQLLDVYAAPRKESGDAS